MRASDRAVFCCQHGCGKTARRSGRSRRISPERTGERTIAMTKSKKLVLVAAAAATAFVGLFWSEDITPSFKFVSEAQAVIGRPLTPMSYAGVARRTVRRCAAGVYYC